MRIRCLHRSYVTGFLISISTIDRKLAKAVQSQMEIKIIFLRALTKPLQLCESSQDQAYERSQIGVECDPQVIRKMVVYAGICEPHASMYTLFPHFPSSRCLTFPLLGSGVVKRRKTVYCESTRFAAGSISLELSHAKVSSYSLLTCSGRSSPGRSLSTG